MVDQLISLGADINFKDASHATPLHHAIFGQNNEIVRMLIQNHYGTAPVDPCRPQNRGSHHYLRAHKGSRRLSRPLIQDSSVRVLFP